MIARQLHGRHGFSAALRLLSSVALLGVASCTGAISPPSPSTSHCVAGAVASCACPGGGSGTQTCDSDGTYGECACADASSVVGALDASMEATPSPDAGMAPEASCTGGGDPYSSDVVLLMHFDGANGSTDFPDATGRHTVSAVGSAQVSTTTSVFGGGSLHLENPAAGGAYLTIASSADWDLTSGDSTVEMWVNPVSLPSANPALLTQSPVSNDGQWTILLVNDPPYAAPAGALNVQDNGNGGTSTSNAVPLGSWRHVAVVRSAGSTLLFIDGVLGATAGAFYTQSSNDLYIGATNTSSYGSQYLWNGYIDELRITKGVARYTANFAPPTQPFLATAGCDDGGA